MPVLDKLQEKAKEAVLDPKRHNAWISSGFDQAVKRMRGLVPSGTEPELQSARDTADYALAKLEKHKGTIVKWGEDGLASTIAMLASGRYDDASRHAALLVVREQASWDQVSLAIVSTAEAGNQKKRELDKAVAETLEVLKDIGVTAAKALLPLALAAI